VIVWVALISLASYRLWRLLGEDSITDPLRARLPDWSLELIECPWCLGSWVAFVVTWATDATVGLQVPVLVGLAAAVVVGALGERL
jgi:hypothetical protein